MANDPVPTTDQQVIDRPNQVAPTPVPSDLRTSGMITPGNIDLSNRPVIQNSDGTHSSEYSFSFGTDKGEVLVPTIVNGKFLTPDGTKPPQGSPAEKEMQKAAQKHYEQTGEHMGIFSTPEAADAYAEKVHNRGQANAQPKVSTEFSGWDQLFAKQGREPVGWKNLITAEPTHPMISSDGNRSGNVPVSQMASARAQGNHVAVPMQAPAPDDRTGWIPMHRATDALKAGFRHIGQYKQAMDSAIEAVRDKRADLAQGINDAVIKHVPNFDLMPPEVQNNVREMVGQGIGFYSGGLLMPGPKGAEAKKMAGTPENPLETALPPVGAIGETSEVGQKVPRPIVEGEPARVPPERTTGKFDADIKEGKAVPGGIQKGDPEIGLPDLAYFHDPATGSTLALPTDQVTPQNVRTQMRTSRAAYLKARPEESQIVPPGHPLHIPEEKGQ